ncbi:CVNH domain-containing protein [Aspergillus terricola var. indicus]
MSSQEYYSDSKYNGYGQGYGNQDPMPSAGNPAYPPAAAACLPPASDTANSSRNSSGYQYQPQEYYGGYQQPPPPYYQHPESPAPAQAPYLHLHPPLLQQPQPASPQVTGQDVHAHQGHNDRGVLGALAGGAAGAYAGHQVSHVVLGTIEGAIAGSFAEDAKKKHSSHGKVDKKKKNKKKKKKKKKKKEKKSWGAHRRRSSSSSSSSSSSDSEPEREDGKLPAPARVPAQGPSDHRGNFSKSSRDISLQGNYELAALCCAVSGHFNASRLPLNRVLMNEFGHFNWKSAGNFGASAKNARLTEGGRVLEAELADGRGGWKRDWVRLDERISNRDGVLMFLD